MRLDACDRDVLNALPHQPPFRLLTDVIELQPGRAGIGVWRVSGEEAVLAGHFPGHPIVPGTLITEALAQLSGLVGYFGSGEANTRGAAPRVKLVHVDMRYKHAIVPPAEIYLRSRQVGTVGLFAQFEAQAECGKVIAARGRLTLATDELPGK